MRVRSREMGFANGAVFFGAACNSENEREKRERKGKDREEGEIFSATAAKLHFSRTHFFFSFRSLALPHSTALTAPLPPSAIQLRVMNALAHAPRTAAYLNAQRRSSSSSSSNASLHRSTPAAISLSSSSSLPLSTSSRRTTRVAASAASASASSPSALRLLSSPASRATAPLRKNAAAAAALPSRRRKGSFAPRASSDDDRSDAPLERALAAAPYLFPLLDGLRYGKFLFR